MQIALAGRDVEIRLSAAAGKALAERQTPLLAEMELLYACMIRMRVHFRDMGTEQATPVSDRFFVSFRPVMTRACAAGNAPTASPAAEFPVADIRPYVPHWLSVDYRGGKWSGKFGYTSTKPGVAT